MNFRFISIIARDISKNGGPKGYRVTATVRSKTYHLDQIIPHNELASSTGRWIKRPNLISRNGTRYVIPTLRFEINAPYYPISRSNMNPTSLIQRSDMEASDPESVSNPSLTSFDQRPETFSPLALAC
jgi:hypothetical protein